MLRDPRSTAHGSVASPQTRRRARVEVTKPAGAVAVARLVVAAREHERRAREHRRGRRQEVGVPGRCVVAVRAAGAVRERRARVLAVEVVADVDHEIGMHRRDRARDAGKRPPVGIVARLRAEHVDAAAGVAQHDDRARIVRRRRQRALADADPPRSDGHRDVAHDVRELLGLARALRHVQRAAVGARARAGRVADDGARVRLAVRAVLQPSRKDRGDEHGCALRRAR